MGREKFRMGRERINHGWEGKESGLKKFGKYSENTREISGKIMGNIRGKKREIFGEKREKFGKWEREGIGMGIDFVGKRRD